jgi:predicted phosphodiesterase
VTRLLTFSDIHGAVPAVAALVAIERTNQYDAVVIAGDIGDCPEDLFHALEPLECPLLYVYGNWDYRLEYDHDFGPHCFHLHGRPIQIGDLSFAGFSGCDAQWGKNPHWLQLEAEIRVAHRVACEQQAAAKESDAAHFEALERACAAELADLAHRTKDRRKRSYKARVELVKWKYLCRQQRECQREKDVSDSQDYQTYKQARGAAWAEVSIRNRAEVVEQLLSLEGPGSRKVLVTHERLYRLREVIPGLGAHLFGHRHGFKVTRQKDTTFVNVSCLDALQVLQPQYGIIEWTSSHGFRVTEKQLRRTRSLLERCHRFHMDRSSNA